MSEAIPTGIPVIGNFEPVLGIQLTQWSLDHRGSFCFYLGERSRGCLPLTYPEIHFADVQKVLVGEVGLEPTKA